MPANDPHGRRFGEAAQAYERGRPDYPPAIVDWLLEWTPRRVVDLGAGTGKLTRDLVGRVESVVAVEPDAGMRTAFAQVLPDVVILPGTGERIPLPDASADAVLASQAWHWVDPDRAEPEVARVLVPGGYLGLVWNDRDESDPWIAQLSHLLEEFGTSPDAGYRPAFGPLFAPMEVIEIPWTHVASVEAVVDMIASRSYVIALGEADQQTLLDLVRAHALSAASTSGEVSVRYVTRGYRARTVVAQG